MHQQRSGTSDSGALASGEACSRATRSGMSAGDWRELVHNVVEPKTEELRAELQEEREYDEAFSLYGDESSGDSSASSFFGATPQPDNWGYLMARAERYSGFCFPELCRAFGVMVDPLVRSVSQLTGKDRDSLKSESEMKVFAVWYGLDHPRNHVAAVEGTARNACITLKFVSRFAGDDRTLTVTSAQQFFGSKEFERIAFYAGDQDRDEAFGGLLSGSGGVGAGPSGSGFVPFPPRKGPESVVAEDKEPGTSNISKGVSRPKKRAIQPKQGAVLGKFGVKNYRTSGLTMFNNVDELFLDKISRVAAQEIVERLFSEWKVPVSDMDSVTYAEDLLWAFMVARTASNKADYNVEFEVPATAGGSVTADFSVFSRLLESEFGVTRRAFARGVADDLRSYLAREDNKFMLPVLAQRLGADPQMATLCFDGSTHCTNLTTSESSFTKLLEARNLFERDDVVADGASSRLMQGMSGGVRSVVPR